MLIQRAMLPMYILLGMQSWLSLRLDTLGAFITFAVALFAVGSSGLLSGSFVAVALTYSGSITSALQAVVSAFSQAEAQMASVERVRHYSTTTPAEAPDVVPGVPPPVRARSGLRIV